MAQHLLDNSQICAMFEHVRCARVAQNMGRKLSGDTSPHAGISNNMPSFLPIETFPSISQKDRIAISSPCPYIGRKLCTTRSTYVFPKSFLSNAPKWYDTFF
jgi:hypothetical protein